MPQINFCSFNNGYYERGCNILRKNRRTKRTKVGMFNDILELVFGGVISLVVNFDIQRIFLVQKIYLDVS